MSDDTDTEAQQRERDEISRLLASIPVLRCPQGHAGSFVVVKTTEFFYHVEDNGKFLSHDTKSFDKNDKDQALVCGICNTRFELPNGYELKAKRRGEEDEEQPDPNASALNPTP